MRAFKRIDRVNKEMLRVISTAIQLEVQDPRVTDVVVVAVRVSADLSVANVYIDRISGDLDEAIAGLNAAKGFLRSKVANSMRLKRIPKLRFFKDEITQQLNRIQTLLDEIEDHD